MLSLVTGGCGFIGSHVVDRLVKLGHKVIVIDNLLTGSKKNLEHFFDSENFSFIEFDVQNHNEEG